MQRLTISLDEEVAALFDAIVADRGYQSRSEAVRDLVRQAVEARRIEQQAGLHCVANLSYVYDHRAGVLVQRLRNLQHDHHDLMVSASHIILDHDMVMESLMLRGPTAAVLALANRIRAERGVRLGAINLVGVSRHDDHAGAAAHHHHHNAGHLSPLTN